MDGQDRKQQFAESLRRLAGSYVLAIRQLEEGLATLYREIELQEIAWAELAPDTRSHGIRTAEFAEPVADRPTFSVIWRGKMCFLGNTLLFRLFEKLVSRPNRYCAMDELLDEIWGGPRSESSVRNVVKRLRDRLSDADMTELAEAIDGSEPGHYILRLDQAE